MPHQSEAVEQRDRAEETEGAVDQPPGKRDASNLAADQGQRKHRRTADEARPQHPGIGDGITPGTDKKERDHDMPKGQPVRAVGDEREVLIRDLQPVPNMADPPSEAAVPGKVRVVLNPQPRTQQPQLMQQREGREAAQQQADDEKAQNEAVTALERTHHTQKSLHRHPLHAIGHDEAIGGLGVDEDGGVLAEFEDAEGHTGGTGRRGLFLVHDGVLTAGGVDDGHGHVRGTVAVRRVGEEDLVV